MVSKVCHPPKTLFLTLSDAIFTQFKTVIPKFGFSPGTIRNPGVSFLSGDDFGYLDYGFTIIIFSLWKTCPYVYILAVLLYLTPEK